MTVSLLVTVAAVAVVGGVVAYLVIRNRKRDGQKVTGQKRDGTLNYPNAIYEGVNLLSINCLLL